MRIFTQDECPQGSPEWHEIRRGIPTASGFDRILTPKTLKPSAQAEKYMAELAADVANLSPHWFSEKMSKPPNRAVADGQAREAESRNWLMMERDVAVELVGFCLSDDGLYGCSPDGLIVADSGSLDATLELKNPQLDTQAEYLLEGKLPSEYRCQCHGQLLVTGLAKCTFLSYAPGLDSLLVDVAADDFTRRLHEAVRDFTRKYLDVLTRLRLLKRFEQQRSTTIMHYPQEVYA